MQNSLPDPTRIKLPREVRFFVSRWRVRVEVETYRDGTGIYEFSADREDTGGDGISALVMSPDGTMEPFRP